MKTSKEKNTEHARKELLRVRPKNAATYDFTAIESVIRQWITGAK